MTNRPAMLLWLCSALALRQPLLHRLNASSGVAPSALFHAWEPGGHNVSSGGPERLFAQYAGAPGPPGSLLVMVVKGCSGSTWMRSQTIGLLDLLGTPDVINLGEGTKDTKNPFLGSGVSLGAGTSRMVQALGAAGKPGLLKALPVDGQDQTFLSALQQDHAKVGLVRRANLLDVLFCAARDCFEAQTAGLVQQVDAAGRPVPCRSRRFDVPKPLRGDREDIASSAERLHVIDPHRLVLALSAQLAQSDAYDTTFRSAGVVKASVTFERLTAYEYGREHLAESVAEWCKLLIAYGAPDTSETRATIRRFLEPEVGTFERRSHGDVLSNYEEVKVAFATARPEVQAMLN